MLGFAQSAIHAGYVARAANLRVTNVTYERRNARVFIPDDKKNEDPVTASRWIESVGGGSIYWQDEALGAGEALGSSGWVGVDVGVFAIISTRGNSILLSSVATPLWDLRHRPVMHKISSSMNQVTSDREG